MNTKKVHGNIDFNNNPCYFQIYKSARIDKMTVVEMQEFDEHDYIQNRFVRDIYGDIHCFEEEYDAIKKLNEWFTPNEIDPEYLIYEKNDDEEDEEDIYIIRD